MSVDITVRSLAEEKFRLAVEACPNGMIMFDGDGTLVMVNTEIERQFGYRRDELIGQSVDMLVPERLRSEHARHREAFNRRPEARRIGADPDVVGLRKDGSEFLAEVGLTSIRTSKGLLVLSVIVDVSTRRQMERLKDEFVSTVSHELRTPLTSISGSLGLLVGQWAGTLPRSAARLLVIAHKNSQRLVRLVNDILDIEKIESGRVAFKQSRVDVGSLVEQAVESNRGFADGYGVRVRFDAVSACAEVNADPDRLAQVVTNLLSNAIKFSPVGGEVVVTVEKRGDVVHISVRDHGSGIPPDFKSHVFEKFAQADATNSRQKGGTGLGLSIVKQIVDRLEGEVGFDAAPGGGTIFYVALPVRDAAIGWETDLDAQPAAERILLCEDDRDTAAAMREKLRLAGFATDITYTETAALTRASEFSYAAILVDLQLPDGDGISLILRLRGQAQHHDTPIIVVSVDPGRGREDVRSSTLNVLGWLSKPVDFDHLVQVLRAKTASTSGQLPRILHVDDDHDILAVVAETLRTVADVVSVDSIESARRALAVDHIDLVVLDVALGASSGLELLPALHDREGIMIPVVIFSAQGAGVACNEQIQAGLSKSQASLEGLSATIRDRLEHRRAHLSKEVA